MSQFDRNRWRRSLVLFVPVVIFVSAALAGPLPSSQPTGRMGRAVDRTLQEGLHATLPPHLSTLLGISSEKASPIMQGVIRSEKVVRGFDVLLANRNDVVLFVVNENTNDQVLYLTSRAGTLRKVVSVKGGIGEVVGISSEGRKAFEKEKQFWLDRLAPVEAAK